jgi:hypothetical protein
MATECAHQWQYQGVVYSTGAQRPGSGACDRVYEDKYFCSKCLDAAYRNSRVVGHDYNKAIEGTLPK